MPAQHPLRTPLRAVVLLLLSLLLIPIVQAGSYDTEILIGLRAHSGAERDMQKWGPTADYLSEQIPGYRFRMVPFESIGMLNEAISREDYDFVLTNPASYALYEKRYGASRLVTLINQRQGKGYTRFGSVIFTRDERDDIQGLEDLKGKSFMAVSEQAFGGWRMAWRELKHRGIAPYRDFRPMMFSGGIQEQVVHAVLRGEADAGCVRTDMLERMAAAGEIKLSDIKIIGTRHTAGFPFIHSTQLYPEWPFAKLAHTDDVLAEKVARALLAMPPDHPAALSGHYEGWHTPLDYQPVHALLEELSLPPYRDETPDSHTLLFRYWPWLAASGLLLLVAIATIIHLKRLNNRLRETEQRLTASNEKLQDMVTQDGLTGIGNRRRLRDFLALVWGQAARQRLRICAIMFDIDHFKEYNDHYGHLAGDDCLRHIADQASQLFRRSGDLLVRHGGEEFLVILTDTTPSTALDLAQRLRLVIEELHIPHARSSVGDHVTISLGVAHGIPAHDSSPDALIEAADQAMYRAKQHGRNCVMMSEG